MRVVDWAERLRQVLAARERIALPNDTGVRCAVLVPLVADPDGYRVVYTVRTDYVVTPVVGVVRPDARFEPNPDEVAHLFSVSLADLRDPSRHGKLPRKWGDQWFDVDVIRNGAHEIWGLTLNITRNLLDCVERLRADG